MIDSLDSRLGDFGKEQELWEERIYLMNYPSGEYSIESTSLVYPIC
jgi:hypothetical protein